jgi:two-component system alkaline phosphatase synthesis response regulator PhoP
MLKSLAEKTKLLLVDDEPDIIEFLSYNFLRNGYEVKSACNGLEALKLLEFYHPDIILSDILMPELNGIDLCKALKHDDRFREIPFVFMSASNDEFIALTSIAAGGAKYLTKTVHVSSLLDVMQATLKQAS